VSKKNPKVSVCVVTYNQEKYIRKCLQSIVDQETDFDFEVIVGEDCSTDGTRTIVKEFAKKYPTLVNLIMHNKNVGGFENYRAIHRAASGKYIAHMDGDDYMLPGKLQAQCVYLEKNKNYSACAHYMEVIDEQGIDKGYTLPRHVANRDINLETLLRFHPLFMHSSLMYRKACLSINLLEHECIDFMIYYLLAMNGPIAFIDEFLGKYRIGVGVSSDSKKFLPYIINVYDQAAQGGVDGSVIAFGKSHTYYGYAWRCLKISDVDEFRNYIILSYNTKEISRLQTILYFLRNSRGALMILRKVRLWIDKLRRRDSFWKIPL
jgi:glycosyltransferase involved in cell wall biosynthesis